MSMLTIYDESGAPQQAHLQPEAIAGALAPLNIDFQRYPTVALPQEADSAAVLHAYAEVIAELQHRAGYQAVDVVRMLPTHPDVAPLRAKFLSEHTHADDEVRLFVEGGGLFCLHIGDKVYALTCTAGDYIRVPAGAAHWFDMGAHPQFTAVRLFMSPEGWAPEFTGSPISSHFPEYAAVRARVIDIEGTVGSIAFVKNVLFPYARAQLRDYVQAHTAELEPLLQEVPGENLDAKIACLLQWSDDDVKAPPLKALQGMIWRAGYETGAFHGHVYDDAVTDLRAQHAAGVPVYVYSSGSIEAQQLLFRHSVAGDLTPLLSGHFDTRIGDKKHPDSYRSIAEAIKVPAAEILFFSDHPDELRAARTAGWQTVGVRREDCAFDLSEFPTIRRF